MNGPTLSAANYQSGYYFHWNYITFLFKELSLNYIHMQNYFISYKGESEAGQITSVEFIHLPDILSTTTCYFQNIGYLKSTGV